MYEYSGLASALAKKGRFGDSMLMHVNPIEVEMLNNQGMLTTNPDTGQPEAFAPLIALLGMIPAAATAAAPMFTGIGTALGAIPGVGGALAAVPNLIGTGLAGAGSAGTGMLGLSTAAEAAAAAAAAPSAAMTAATTVPGTLGMTAAELGVAPTMGALESAMIPAASTIGTGSFPTALGAGLEASMIPAANTIGTGIANIPGTAYGAGAMQGIGEGLGTFMGAPSLETAGGAIGSIAEPVGALGKAAWADPTKAMMALVAGDMIFGGEDEEDIYDDTITGELYDAPFGERVDPPPGYNPGLDAEHLYFQDFQDLEDEEIFPRGMAEGGPAWAKDEEGLGAFKLMELTGGPFADLLRNESFMEWNPLLGALRGMQDGGLLYALRGMANGGAVEQAEDWMEDPDPRSALDPYGLFRDGVPNPVEAITIPFNEMAKNPARALIPAPFNLI